MPDVGYMRRLSAEPILSLEPDIVLAAADAGPPEALAQLRAAGVEVVEVPAYVFGSGLRRFHMGCVG